MGRNSVRGDFFCVSRPKVLLLCTPSEGPCPRPGLFCSRMAAEAHDGLQREVDRRTIVGAILSHERDRLQPSRRPMPTEEAHVGQRSTGRLQRRGVRSKRVPDWGGLFAYHPRRQLNATLCVGKDGDGCLDRLSSGKGQKKSYFTVCSSTPPPPRRHDHNTPATRPPRARDAPATCPRRVRAGPAARLLARARRGASPARRALRRLASLPCRRCRRHGGRCGAASAAARADQRQPRAAPLLDAKGHACLNSFMRPRVHARGIG